MKIRLLNNTKYLNKSNDIYDEIEVFINDILLDGELYFSHMIIDGVEVYDNYEIYIEENLLRIENIIVEVKTVLQFFTSIILSINEYSSNAIPELKQLSTAFYNSSSSESWKKLTDFLEALQWINEAIVSINSKEIKPNHGDKYLGITASFENVFPNLLEALEGQDNIFIADILNYEIIPLLQDLITCTTQFLEENNTHAEGKH
ncbi:hypothetical protein SM124_09380 [Bacillus sp. 31A1R]|uniref:DUF8042 domain-containing protein n=1 Tax=Robertmurraya mangrovi TaxID=3098077 RepID=A0ABU5IXR2_9BACI|nr:hypothetical protein [Bacillus sp. 31A1R]MDZ5471958.1 hypothetical protein [Bacillus sp. 31A1R]